MSNVSFSRRMASFILSQVICVPFLRRPFQDLTHPNLYGMKRAIDFRIPLSTETSFGETSREPPDVALTGATLGAWLMSPEEEHHMQENEVNECLAPNAMENFQTGTLENERLSCVEEIGPKDIVILYLHGNAETRSQFHRRELYKIYQRSGYFVLAVDYRGYGDSSPAHPNEETMRDDALATYRWLRGNCHPETKVVVHGHSLGSGVATRMMAHLALHGEGILPSGLILEAPFNRMIDEVRTFKIATAAQLVLDLDIVLKDAKCEYDSQRWIREIRQPIMILHAKDDNIVPYELGLKLYEDSRSVCDIDMVTYDEEHKFGHENIYLDPELGARVEGFVQKL